MDVFLLELGSLEWDLLAFTETWREEKQEIWETMPGHTWFGSGGMRGSCGVGFLLCRRWSYK
eukprot:8152258-Karenia_brevis.AAC.1